MLDEKLVREKIIMDMEDRINYLKLNRTSCRNKAKRSIMSKRHQWLIQQLGFESSIKTDPSIWRLTKQGMVFYHPTSSDDITEEEKTHMIYPIMGALEDGGKFDYEIAYELDKPIFMIQHGLRKIVGMEEGCPYSFIESKCIGVQRYAEFIEPIKPKTFEKVTPKRVADKLDELQIETLRYGGSFNKIDDDNYSIEGFLKPIDLVNHNGSLKIYYPENEGNKKLYTSDGIKKIMKSVWNAKIQHGF